MTPRTTPLLFVAALAACGGKSTGTGAPGGTATADDDVTKCDAGDAAACKSLARAYDEGYGVAENKPLAFSYMKKACDLGDLDGCTDQALWYGRGNGVERDPDKEYDLMDATCSKDWAMACYWMGWSFSDYARSLDPAMNDDDMVPVDDWERLLANSENLVFEYLTKACGLGEEDSCFVLRHGLDQDPVIREGHYWFLPEGCCQEEIPEGADEAYLKQFD